MSALPPFSDYDSLVRWIGQQESWEAFEPLLATGSERHLRMVYRYATPAVLGMEQLERVLQRHKATKLTSASLELAALAANASLSPAVVERLFDWLRERMKESASWKAQEDSFVADDVELILLRTLEETGHHPPADFYLPLYTLVANRKAEEGKRAQAALFLMEGGASISPEQEASIWRIARLSPQLAIRLLRHPATSLETQREIAREFREDRFVRQALARHPVTRMDAEIRERLLDSGCYLSCSALTAGANPEEVRRMFQGIMRRDPVHALQLLEELTATQAAALQPEDLLPLLQSTNATVRLHAQIAWSALRGEESPEVSKKKGRSRRVG